MRLCTIAIVAGSVGALSPLSTAGAADMPQRKSGLWEIHTQTNVGGGMTMQVCIDQKQDDLTARQGKDMAAQARKQCSKMDVKRSGNRTEIDSVCKFDNVTATTHAVVTGNMVSDYQMDSTTRFDPPMQGMAQGHTVVTGKWIGPCKPGQHHGSMTIMGMPGGGNYQITPEMMQQMQKMRQQYGH